MPSIAKSRGFKNYLNKNVPSYYIQMTPLPYQTLAVSGLALLALDAMYITATKQLFAEQVAAVQRVTMTVRMPGVFMCYALLIVGLYYFILKEKRSIFDAFLLGIVIYGVFDSTNYALFKHWRPSILVMDTLWGGILFALATYFTYALLY